MHTNNKVIWSEGMFLQQQHFQQYDRYIHHLCFNRPGTVQPYHWGIEKLSIDQQALVRGKYALTSCRAILPDGHIVDMPEHDSVPVPISMEEGVVDTLIYLALPMQLAGISDASFDQENYRYRIENLVVLDNIADSHSEASIQIGKLCFKLLFEHEHREGYTCLPIARVQEVKQSGEIILDTSFVPPALFIDAHPNLISVVKDVENLLHYRAGMLVERLKGAATGVAEVTDFMLLQIINRYEPVLAYYRKQGKVHPEQLYQFLLQLSGELSTFTDASRRFPKLPDYNHIDLENTFSIIVKSLRQALSIVLEESAISLRLEQKEENTWVTTILDKTLLNKAVFVLAVYANMPNERLREEFPAQIKIAPVEELRSLVTRALPGINVQTLQAAPRQIPYFANYAYFALNNEHPLWKSLHQSAAIAFHVSGIFPGLKLNLWAVRG